MYSIEKIEYQTNRCFGTCPQFIILIDELKNATFDAQEHNRIDKKGKEIKGKFKTIIRENEFNEIVSSLIATDFPNLNDNYSVGWKDDHTCFLTVSYDNGKLKRIVDYGLNGTPELKKFYQLMFELRFNQDWVKR